VFGHQSYLHSEILTKCGLAKPWTPARIHDFVSLIYTYLCILHTTDGHAPWTTMTVSTPTECKVERDKWVESKIESSVLKQILSTFNRESITDDETLMVFCEFVKEELKADKWPSMMATTATKSVLKQVTKRTICMIAQEDSQGEGCHKKSKNDEAEVIIPRQFFNTYFSSV